MPPRRPIAKGAEADRRSSPSSRDPGTSVRRPVAAGEEDENPFPEEDSGYRTGNDYPVAERELDEDAPELEGAEGRDVYGEDDPYGEDDGYRPREDSHGGGDGRTYTRGEMEALHDDDQGAEPMDAGPDATRAGPPVHLDIIEGPDKGKKKRFSHARMVVGRTPGCELQLSDQSVSRRHAELILGQGGIVLRDLGSGNGTKVNGERVGECVLQHDDVISIGKTKLRFHDDIAAIEQARLAEEQRAEEAQKKKEEEETRRKENAEARAKAEADAAEARKKREEEDAQKRTEREAERAERRARQKKILTTFGATFGAVFGLVAIALLIIKAPGMTEGEKIANEKMTLARQAFADGKYDDAVRLIHGAMREVPEIDKDGELALAKRESEVEVILVRARAALDEQRFEDARIALQSLPAESERGQREKAAIEEERVAREQAVLVGAGEAALQEENLVEARKLLEFLLPEARERLEKKILAAEEEAERLALKNQKKQAAQRDADKRRYAVQRRAYMTQAFGPVSLKFHAEDYQRAALDCARVVEANPGATDVAERSRELERLIPQFARSYEDGQRKIKVGNVSGAESNLRKARELYQRIGMAGPLGTKIDQALATSLVASGKAALARKDLGAAAVAYRDAMRIDPDVSGARDGTAQIQMQAERLYLEALSAKDRRPQEAVTKLRVVLLAATPGSSVYTKAQGQLAQLEKPLPEDL